MNVDSLMRAVGVRRWHTEPQIGDETDGHHSAVVALLSDYFAETEELTISERYYLVREALRHDLGEYWSGDLPAPVKKVLSKELLTELNEAEARFRFQKLQFGNTPLLEAQRQILTISDTIAAAVHCARQAMLGNRDGVRILRILCEYLQPQFSVNYCVLRKGTQLAAIRLMRECAMIADSDMLLPLINRMEKSVCPS